MVDAALPRLARGQPGAERLGVIDLKLVGLCWQGSDEHIAVAGGSVDHDGDLADDDHYGWTTGTL